MKTAYVADIEKKNLPSSNSFSSFLIKTQLFSKNMLHGATLKLKYYENVVNCKRGVLIGEMQG